MGNHVTNHVYGTNYINIAFTICWGPFLNYFLLNGNQSPLGGVYCVVEIFSVVKSCKLNIFKGD